MHQHTCNKYCVHVYIQCNASTHLEQVLCSRCIYSVMHQHTPGTSTVTTVYIQYNASTYTWQNYCVHPVYTVQCINIHLAQVLCPPCIYSTMHQHTPGTSTVSILYIQYNASTYTWHKYCVHSVYTVQCNIHLAQVLCSSCIYSTMHQHTPVTSTACTCNTTFYQVIIIKNN